jgi:regulator of sirC expression with transglutaminase-like and TPR domain
MLNNLRGVYYRSHQVEKAIQVLDLLITAVPDAAEEHKQRGMLNLALERRRRALPDLEKYLLLAPEAGDRRDIEMHIREIKQYLRSVQ